MHLTLRCLCHPAEACKAEHSEGKCGAQQSDRRQAGTTAPYPGDIPLNTWPCWFHRAWRRGQNLVLCVIAFLFQSLGATQAIRLCTSHPEWFRWCACLYLMSVPGLLGSQGWGSNDQLVLPFLECYRISWSRLIIVYAIIISSGFREFTPLRSCRQHVITHIWVSGHNLALGQCMCVPNLRLTPWVDDSVYGVLDRHTPIIIIITLSFLLLLLLLYCYCYYYYNYYYYYWFYYHCMHNNLLDCESRYC
jgi:hypothetical protein